MSTISDYENAKAKYYNSLALPSTSLLSISFYGDFLNNYKKSYEDWTRLQGLLSKTALPINEEKIKDHLLDEVVIVTDSELKILFASHNLSKMNGYKENEVLGNTPKMFQGPQTNPITKKYIRDHISQNLPFEAKVINHKKNGKIYDCSIQAEPIFDKNGKLTHFIALEKA